MIETGYRSEEFQKEFGKELRVPRFVSDERELNEQDQQNSVEDDQASHSSPERKVIVPGKPLDPPITVPGAGKYEFTISPAVDKLLAQDEDGEVFEILTVSEGSNGSKTINPPNPEIYNIFPESELSKKIDEFLIEIGIT